MTDPRNIIPSLRIPADNLPVNEDIISTSHFGPDRISPNLQGVIRRLLLDISTTPQDILQNTYRTLSMNFDAVLNIWLSSKEMQEYFTLFDLNPTYQDYYIGYFGKTILNSLLYDIIENQENVAKKSYITTKFFAFIKNHDISVDTLVSMVKMLKSVVFRSNQFSPEGYFLVNVGFDIMMPTMDGFETLRVIRQLAPSLKTKIIMFTNLNSQADIDRCMDLGADDFLLKANTTPREAVERIRVLLEKPSSILEYTPDEQGNIHLSCPDCQKAFTAHIHSEK